MIPSFSSWLAQPPFWNLQCKGLRFQKEKMLYPRQASHARSGCSGATSGLEGRMHKKLTHHHVRVGCIQSPEPPEPGCLAGHAAHGKLFPDSHRFSIFLDASFLLDPS
jgi:hypothetical protein